MQTMQWRRGRRATRGTGKKAQKDYAAETVKNFGSKILYNRWHLLAPFPLKRVDVYNAMFTPEQHHAMGIMAKFGSALVKDRDVYIKWDTSLSCRVNGTNVRATYLHLKMPFPVAVPETDPDSKGCHTFLMSALPTEMIGAIYEWGEQWLKAAIETHQTNGKLFELFEICSTIGQVKRLWPNACNLLPESAQAILRNAKVRSPYPLEVLDISRTDTDKEVRELKPQWRPEELAWYDDRLTEALCLPMVHETPVFKVDIKYA